MTATTAREAAHLVRGASCPLCHARHEVDNINIPGLRIDLSARRAWVHGTEVRLSRKEFDVLTCFAKRPGQVLTKLQLYRDAWGHPDLPETTRTVEAVVSRMRCKLRRASVAVSLNSVWGVGWRLDLNSSLSGTQL